jgi:hypothetical protein
MSEETTPNSDPILLLAEEKAKLEIEKLKMELSFQKNPFKNPVNWAPFATLIGATFALIWGISSGWFVNQNDKLEIKNAKLEQQQQLLQANIKAFELKRNSLEAELTNYKSNIKLMSDSLQYLDSSQKDMKTILELTRRELDNARMSIMSIRQR